jgi:hypothetical protein
MVVWAHSTRTRQCCLTWALQCTLAGYVMRCAPICAQSAAVPRSLGIPLHTDIMALQCTLAACVVWCAHIYTQSMAVPAAYGPLCSLILHTHRVVHTHKGCACQGQCLTALFTRHKGLPGLDLGVVASPVHVLQQRWQSL